METDNSKMCFSATSHSIGVAITVQIGCYTSTDDVDYDVSKYRIKIAVGDLRVCLITAS